MNRLPDSPTTALLILTLVLCAASMVLQGPARTAVVAVGCSVFATALVLMLARRLDR